MKIRFKRTHQDAVLPTKGTDFAAGMDLYSVEEIIIPPKGRAIIPVGLTLAYCEPGYWLMLAMRSSKRFKLDLYTEGIIDSDYRGDMGVKVWNQSDQIRVIEKGERFAQIVVIPQPGVEIEEGEIENTERGENGLGSTGRF